MELCDYYPSKSDPCLFIREEAEGTPLSFVIIYVDDGGIIGTPQASEEVIQSLSHLRLKLWGRWNTLYGATSLKHQIETLSGFTNQS